MVFGMILIIIGVIVFFYHFIIDTNSAIQQTVQYLGFVCGSIFFVGGIIVFKIDKLKEIFIEKNDILGRQENIKIQPLLSKKKWPFKFR
jgi:membrane-bound ClpP family serine protease